MTLVTGWTDPSAQIEALLLLSSHSAYRAACDSVMAGQLQEAQPQLRSCLEYAGYALHMNANPGHATIWAQRSDSDAARSASKNAFKAVDIQTSIQQKDSTLGSQYKTLYDRTIDYGAHPNELGVFSRVRRVKTADGVEYNLLYLQDDEGMALKLACRTAAQVGVCALLVFNEVFPDRYKAAGIDAALKTLRLGL
jgi:hypothetical protein